MILKVYRSLRNARGAAASALLIAACQSVPYTHRSHLVLISAGEEASLGVSSYQQALSQARLSTG